MNPIEIKLPANDPALRCAMKVVKREGKTVTALFSEDTWRDLSLERSHKEEHEHVRR